MSGTDSNLFCRLGDLRNEASVESFFVLRLLRALGYEDSDIRTKPAIEELRVPLGSRNEPYRPDFVVTHRGKPVWLVEAKSTTEQIERHTVQCAGYALQINRGNPDKPLRHYMLTNGLLTRIYLWDQEEAVLSLRFADFAVGNNRYEALRKLLSSQALDAARARREVPSPQGQILVRPAMDAVKRAFLRCHRIIWKSEKMSPQAAFMEFSKLLFVKLWEDRRLRDDPETLGMIARGEPLPAGCVRLCVRWVEEQEANDPNPVEVLLFRQLVEALESDIAAGKRKRIFESRERLRLSPGTVKNVVRELESFYLFGIDEDLNGRMFEAFLAATMRGQSLGQYFTPRSIVKLVARLARLRAVPDHVERVLDACCGTGGFLIEALTDMRQQVWNNQALTDAERRRLLDEVANQAIFGIDAGRDPAVARIARINMYLHGDGGSRVYMADALRHPPQPSTADPLEVRKEVGELAALLRGGPLFDACLTNPPFSMDYSATVPEEKEVLETYELASYGGRKRNSLRSAVMFIERYWQLLRPGGRLLTVIDDGVLSGKNFAFVRQFIRDRFVVRAVISLHGDAFQRAGARAKTSILYLVKRQVGEDQPAVFVYETRFVGLDDVVPRTRPTAAQLAKAQAEEEMRAVVDAFGAYMQGEAGPWLVPPERLGDRLDAKYLRPWSACGLEPSWVKVGATVETLECLVDPVSDEATIIDPDATYDFLRISYQGRAERGERVLGREISYPRVWRVRPGDIVISNINAVFRAIGVVPASLQDTIVSNEFTVLRLKPGIRANPLYLWSVLRSPAIVAEWLSMASGVGRTRVDWDLLRTQRVPLLPYEQQVAVGDRYRAADELEERSRQLRAEAAKALLGLELEAPAAQERLATAKPPR